MTIDDEMEEIYKNYGRQYDYFIKKYEIIDNKIKVFFHNTDTCMIDYNAQNINEIENQMKSQVIDSNNLFYKYKRDNLVSSIWLVNNSWFTYYTYMNYEKLQDKKYLILMYIFLLSALTNAGYILKNNKRINIIKKYQYFIENEKLIKYDINKRYMQECNTNEINELNISKILINDLNKYTITEIREIVELIKDNYKDELILKKM